MNDRNRLFPALRCRMGSCIYYATFMSFSDVEEWIKPTDEIHSSKELSRWIQRQLIRRHADGIADYLVNQKERFFNAIVVGIYGGEPTWAPLRLSAPPGGTLPEIRDVERESLQASIGLLTLSGDEKLFAIDGQHRVSGIKVALKLSRPTIEEDEIVVLFVGHETTPEGEQRTRRLFTTLNKTARKVSDADRVALDEDDGFAVVTRRMIDEFGLFRRDKIIAFAPTASIPTNDEHSISTIICLYSQLKDLYSPTLTGYGLKKSHFGGGRPSDDALQQVYESSCDYWRALRRFIPQVNEVLSGKVAAGRYREPKKNHLLIRPIGQRAFAGAVGVLVARGASIVDAVKRLSKLDLWIHKDAWDEILWDRIQGVMLKSPLLAETLLLRQIGEKGRSKARDLKLDETLKKRASSPESVGEIWLR